MVGNTVFIQTCNTQSTDFREQFRHNAAELTALEMEKRLDLMQFF